LELSNSNIYKNNICIRNIDVTLSTKPTIFVMDRNESPVMEVKNDLKETFSDSLELVHIPIVLQQTFLMFPYLKVYGFKLNYINSLSMQMNN
jgi:hypothetical protein